MAFWGAVVYFRDQKRARALHMEQEIASNLNQIIAYTQGEANVTAQVVSALTNLNVLAYQLENRHKSTNKEKRKVAAITNVITTAIREDIDFGNVKQLKIIRRCFNCYLPYPAYLRLDPGMCEFVIARYLDTLETLRGRNREYLARISYDRSQNVFVQSGGYGISEDDFRLFLELLVGIHDHYQLVSDASRRDEIVKSFTSIIGNEGLGPVIVEGM